MSKRLAFKLQTAYLTTIATVINGIHLILGAYMNLIKNNSLFKISQIYQTPLIYTDRQVVICKFLYL